MNERNKKILKIGFFVICTIVMFIFVAYAAFAFAGIGEKENKATTGTLILTLDESATEGISLQSTIPLTDAEGLTTTAYTFSIKNTGTLNANYQLSLLNDDDRYTSDGCSDNKMPWTLVKYAFTKNSGTETIALLNSDPKVLDTGLLEPQATNSYTLQLWIDASATNEIMGTHFHGKIQVQAIQEGQTDYDTGA